LRFLLEVVDLTSSSGAKDPISSATGFLTSSPSSSTEA
jgi:hypothetical protein